MNRPDVLSPHMSELAAALAAPLVKSPLEPLWFLSEAPLAARNEPPPAEVRRPSTSLVPEPVSRCARVFRAQERRLGGFCTDRSHERASIAPTRFKSERNSRRFRAEEPDLSLRCVASRERHSVRRRQEEAVTGCHFFRNEFAKLT